MKKGSELTAIDLFSGAGGASLGFVRAGFKILLANDINDECAETYQFNHKNTIFIKGDIRRVPGDRLLDKIKNEFDVDEIEILIGGPPCEGFSIAGLRDPNDPRNKLFEELLRIVRAVQPKWIVMENVPGILSMEHGEVLKRIVDAFKKLTYHLQWSILNAADYGVPQIRKRVFFIATKENHKIIFPEPTHQQFNGNATLPPITPYVTVWEAISDLPPVKPGEEKTKYLTPPQNKYQEIMRKRVNLSGLKDHRTVKHRKYMIERFKHIPPGGGLKDVPAISRIRPKKIYAARCRRLLPNAPSYTVTAHCLDELLHPIQHRAITVREAARLQSFPDSYIFRGPLCMFHSDPRQDRYEQIGDAVPPLLAEKIALEIKKRLGRK